MLFYGACATCAIYLRIYRRRRIYRPRAIYAVDDPSAPGVLLEDGKQHSGQQRSGKRSRLARHSNGIADSKGQ